VYILASQRRGTLYVGVTSDLVKRMYQHRENQLEGFTKKYSVHMLAYYEIYNDVLYAINREKTLKNWHRSWKIRLIEKHNPSWKNLFVDNVVLCLPNEEHRGVKHIKVGC
jgi:putative endonuclease